MLNEFSRTQLLLGPEAMEKLAQSRVAVFGIGGEEAIRSRLWRDQGLAHWI